MHKHVSEGSVLPQRGIRRSFKTAFAAVLAFAVAILGLVVPAAAVAAPVTSNGVTLTVTYGGETYDGTTVVKPGTSYTASIAYDLTKVTPGQKVRIGVPDGIDLVDFSLKDNEAIASVVREGDELVVTFGETFANNQGFYDFTFDFDEPTTGSSYEEIEWRLDDQTSVDEVIVKDPDDQFAWNIDNSLRKNVDNQNLSSYVSFDSKTGKVALKDGITDATVAYTLTLNSADARSGAVVSDTISEYLAYNQGSFTAKLTTWDENGLNKSVDDIDLAGLSFDGQSFEISGLDLPEQSVLTISYTASVSADKVDALRDALQVQADKVIDANTGNGGWFGVDLKNSATINGAGETTGSFGVGANVPGDSRPNTGAAFAKSVDVQGDQTIALDEDGKTLTEPIDVTYTLQADLTQFAEYADTRYALSHNVVINDFPEQPAIVLGGTITATVNGEARALTEATGVSVADFFGDDYVGTYQWFDREDGSRGFRVNVGQDTTEKWILTVPGQIVSIEGANEQGVWDAKIAKKYQAANTADFYYNGAGGGFDHRYGQNFLVIPKDAGEEVKDDNAFNKTVGELPKMTKGEAYPVTFTFTLTENAIVDFGQSKILDHVNHDVFNVTDDTLAAIKDSITGSYGWENGLSGDDFDLSIADDGDLVFEASDSFGSQLTWAKPEGALNKHLSISFTLMTHVVQGKQTIDVSNSASVVGGTKNGFEWVNDATGSATSYGNELEVQKHVYAGDGEWSQNLRVELGADGLPVQSEFVFRISVLPHGSYANRAILDIVDNLPEGTTFLGFVNDENLDNDTLNTSQTVDLDGNLQATVTDGKVTISQREGTTLNGKSPWVNFKLRIDSYTDADEFVANVGTTNKIGSAQATVTGSDGYPLQILKTDSDNPNTVITDRTARFTVTGPDGSVITDEAFVVDGQIMIEDPKTGRDSAIVVPETADHQVPAGTYTITEVKAPKGYEQPEEGVTFTATIRADGSSGPVTIANDPATEPTPEPTPTETPDPTPTPTEDPTPTPDPTPDPTPTPTPTEDPTPTPEPTPTETPEPTPSPTEDPTPTPSPTEDPTPTPTPTEDPTPTPDPTPTETPEPTPTEDPTPTPEPTDEPTPTPEPTDEPTPTKTPTPEPTEEPTPTPEPTTDPTPVVPTPTEEPTPEPTDLPSPTPTADPEPRPTEYPSPAPTEDPEPKPTEEPSPAPSDEPTPEPAPTPTANPAPAPTPAPSQTPKGELNPTGGDMALPLGALGATLLVGGVAVYAIRRRTQQ
ncbi:SpaA isopeptide-forming pilin-related protein [Microbacterium sorbitolivorans]|uniref:SpaA isopeptide-forming pilin-related protein n=1 Tax=Microbacterium sorbitolivorans TaxID=1867410 RepID=UPI001C9E2762|nr:SpaA isopeptide-forming pilin-related protein [Microbacterium sorbitolivorans]